MLRPIPSPRGLRVRGNFCAQIRAIGCHPTLSRFCPDSREQRGTTPQRVRTGMGDGRALTAQRAVGVGLADRVATMDQVLAELSVRKVR